ncbi:7675_t:CDS:10, partial [Funneliformis caledonium]
MVSVKQKGSACDRGRLSEASNSESLCRGGRLTLLYRSYWVVKQIRSYWVIKQIRRLRQRETVGSQQWRVIVQGKMGKRSSHTNISLQEPTAKYRKILNLALKESHDSEVLSKLRRMKRTADEARLLLDWETWMQQKAVILVCRSVRNTNLHIHEEINSFAQNKTSQFFSKSENSRKRKIGDQSGGEFHDDYESENEESEDDDIEDNSEVHGNKNGGESEDVEEDNRVKIDKNEFVQVFEKIPESSKLKLLSSGKVVKNVLFNYIKDNDCKHLAYSFIIDCDDQKIKELFNDEEWMELTKDHLGISRFHIASEIAKYGNKTLKQLREVVMKSYLPSNVSYDNYQHSDLEWIQIAIRIIVHLYENDDSLYNEIIMNIDLPLYELPHNFSIDKFKHILKFLVSIYQYKTILKNNIQVLREEEDPEEDLEEDQKEQNILNELLNVGQQQVPPSNTNVNYFADCFRIPRKPRQKKGE